MYNGKNRIQIVRVDKGNFLFSFVKRTYLTSKSPSGLIQTDGTLSHHDMFDYLNLTNAGAKKVFEPISDLLNQILSEGEAEKDLTPSE